MATLYQSVKQREAFKRLNKTMRKRFDVTRPEITGVVAGHKLVRIGGQLFPSTIPGTSKGQELSLKNIGSAAAALYAPASGGSGTSSTSSGTTTTTSGDGGALQALIGHASLDFAEAHGSGDATTNRSSMFFSIKFNVVGGTGVDESNNLILMLNAVGLVGGGRVIVRAYNPLDPIYIAKTVSIYYSNVKLTFQSPVIYGAGGQVRVMGEMDQFTRKVDGTAIKLKTGTNSSVNVDNETVFTLSAVDGALLDAVPSGSSAIIQVGDKVVVRGVNDVGGKALQKDISYVKTVAKVGSDWKVTVVDELDYTFQATYTTGDSPISSSDWGPDATTGTTIYIIRFGAFTSDISRGAKTAVVSSVSGFSVGDVVLVSTDQTEWDFNNAAITGAGNKYKNPANLEMVRITAINTGTNTVTFDRSLRRNYTVAKKGGISRLLPVENSSISDLQCTYNAAGERSANAVQINFGVNCHVFGCRITGTDYDPTTLIGRKGHGIRLSYSLDCSAYNNYVLGAKYTGSGEGYGITVYYATSCKVFGNHVTGCRHNILLQNATLAHIHGNECRDDWISSIDLHGVNEMDCLISDNKISRSLQFSSDASQGSGIRIGNTSHVIGAHNCTIIGNLISGYDTTDCSGFDVIGNSSGIVFINNTVHGAYNGFKFTLNSKQITPVQTVRRCKVIGNHFIDCSNRAIYIIGQPTYDNTNSNGKMDGLLLKDNTSTGCSRHFEIAGNSGISNVVVDGNVILEPVASTGIYGFNFKDILGYTRLHNNIASGANKGMYLQNCVNALVTNNILTPTLESVAFNDAGGNTALSFVDPFTPAGMAATLLTAKGDLISASAASTPAIVAVGANPDGYVLTLDAAQATGMKWALPGPGSGAFTTNVSISKSIPRYILLKNDGTTDNKHWDFAVVGLTLLGRAVNDADSVAGNWLTVTRSTTTISSIALAATSLLFSGALTLTGAFEASGAIAGTGALTSKGAAAALNLHNRATNVLSVGMYSPTAGHTAWYNYVAGATRLEIDTGGAIAGNYDTDIAAIFGRMAIGGAGYSDYMSIAHLDCNNTTDYALLQYTTGITYLNAKSGQSIFLRIGNVTKAQLSSTGLAVTGDLSASGNFSVTGHHGTWTAVTFNTGWANWSNAGGSNVRYRVNGDRVELEGIARRTSGSATIIATLPIGPTKDRFFPTFLAVAGVNQAGYFKINPGGQISVEIPTGMGSSLVNYICLDGTFFSTQA